jgi:hypothetical protein
MIVNDEWKEIKFEEVVVYYKEYNRDSRAERGKSCRPFEDITSVPADI